MGRQYPTYCGGTVLSQKSRAEETEYSVSYGGRKIASENKHQQSVHPTDCCSFTLISSSEENSTKISPASGTPSRSALSDREFNTGLRCLRSETQVVCET